MIEVQQLLHNLSQRKVRYLLCGGLAVNIYGVQRSTGDIDILLDFEEENVNSFLSAVKVLHYVNSLPLRLEELVDEAARRKQIDERNLIAYSFYNTLKGRMALDVLVDVPIPFEELWSRQEERDYEGTMVRLVSRGDLIRLKEYAGREQDRQDIILLSKNI
jgi:predicted nucleotidyltransferase